VLEGLLGERAFDYPKSVYAVRDTLAMLTKGNPDALVIDFFAGSGTTLHATAMLNKEDSGRRRCILVTNNEVGPDEQSKLRSAGISAGSQDWEKRGIYHRITRPRVTAAITGERADGSPVPAKLRNADGSPMTSGLAENVEFCELLYLDRNDVQRGQAFEAIARLLWLRAGGRGAVIEKVQQPYAVPEDANYGVLFNISAWRSFAQVFDARPDVSHAYVVTDSLAQYQQVVGEFPPAVHVSMLYEDYLRNFEINTGGWA
jgi:adenine-specific DNA-methyltransferase